MVSKIKLVTEIQKMFPSLRKPERLADVLLAGLELHATDVHSSKSRWQFISKGTVAHALSQAYSKYNLLERKQAPRIRILKYMRGDAPKEDSELRKALNYERQGLYNHLARSNMARQIVTKVLGLSTDSMTAIRNAMESGNVRHQVDTYDKVFTSLRMKGQYNSSYNYVMLGFRFLPDKYWLSGLAQKILANC